MTDIQVNGKRYNPDKSIHICNTPNGILYRKKSGSTEFYLYNPGGKTNAEKITSLSWADANNTVKTYGSRELWMKYFTAMDKSTNNNDGGSTQVRLDSYHRIKAQRNADRRGMNLTEYIKWLITKDDDNRNY